MKSIKRKIFLVFIWLIISVILCGIALNMIFLKPYYIYKNKDIFVKTSEVIKTEYKKNTYDLNDFLNEISISNGMSTYIIDREFNIQYASTYKKQAKISKEIEGFIISNDKKRDDKYSYGIVEKIKDSTLMLVFVTKVDKDKILVLYKPLKGITESVYMTNQFYIMAGILMIVIGSVVMVILSNKLTKPIIEMSRVAENISNLNFDSKIDVTSNDEIGLLGESINHISEKLKESITLLYEDIERRKDLVRNISHELKTPIGIIKGYAEGLQYGVANNKEKMNKYCSVIVNECNQMDNMVRELLHLSKLDSGIFQVKVEDINLCELIKKVMNIFQPEFDKKDISIAFNYDEDIVIQGDFELMEQVMKNFITNAINHIDGENTIEITAGKTSGITRVTVFNTGKHIEEKNINSIWDVFSKVDKARSRQYGGHGLGLSIVKLIIQLHNGTVGVENVNNGVMFNFKIYK